MTYFQATPIIASVTWGSFGVLTLYLALAPESGYKFLTSGIAGDGSKTSGIQRLSSSERIFAASIAALCAFFIVLEVRLLLVLLELARLGSPPWRPTGRSVAGVILNVGEVILGLYLALSPQHLLHWGVKRSRGRWTPEEHVVKVGIQFKLLAILFLLLGLVGLRFKIGF